MVLRCIGGVDITLCEYAGLFAPFGKTSSCLVISERHMTGWAYDCMMTPIGESADHKVIFIMRSPVCHTSRASASLWRSGTLVPLTIGGKSERTPLPLLETLLTGLAWHYDRQGIYRSR